MKNSDSQGKHKIRVVIVDDHSIVRQGLAQILSKTSDLEAAGEAENGVQLLELLRQTPVDVVLMDIAMPGKNGWDTLVQIKNEFPSLPVIILSMYPEDHYALRFLRGGASGYLTKSSEPDQLVNAVRRVAQGKKFVSPELAEKLAFEGGGDTRQAPHESLTDREFEIFCMIAGGKKLKEIAKELSVSITTISSHRGNILRKMDMKTNAELTQYAMKNGIIG